MFFHLFLYQRCHQRKSWSYSITFQMDRVLKKIGPFVVTQRTKSLVGGFLLFSVFLAIILLIKYVWLKYEWVNVHVIPHSHDDVGWLRTPEEYYATYVKSILNHVVFELQKNPNRRFVYVETYFFWKWWEEQTQSVRDMVRNLVQKQQLEIVGGGWCMSDEAVTHYQSFIDQSTWGFRRLNDTLGPIACPTAAWQIDTFGHSSAIASLFAQMGFNSLFFARINVLEKEYRRDHKLLEFIWRGDKRLGDSASIFTSIFSDHYSSPLGFDLETNYDENEVYFAQFAKYVRKHCDFFKTNNILVPMGDDFRFYNAKNYFEKIDSLIRFFDNNPDFQINAFYSTPAIYLNSLVEADLSWPEKDGDFFPYASEPNEYWSGYYTSRPSLKLFERISNNFLQITKQLLVFSNLGVQFFDQLTTLREAVGVLQHHDAVTGTAQQHVSNHYAKLLYEGIHTCEEPVDKALRVLTTSEKPESFKFSSSKPLFKSCLYLNISQCKISETSQRFIVTVYNPLSHPVDHYVRVPITGKHYTVRNAEGKDLSVQIVVISKFVRNLPGRKSKAKAELVFKAIGVPAMGFRSYYVSQNTFKRNVRKIEKVYSKKPIKLIFDPNTQLLAGLKTKSTNISLRQQLGFYTSSERISGAYVFKPLTNAAIMASKNVHAKLLNNGELVKEYEIVFCKWASQVIRTYKDEEYVEFDWVVGPIPIGDLNGKEVILRYTSDIKSGNVFFTDANGLKMQKRETSGNKWNERLQDTETVSKNYYPVTTMISLNDKRNQLNIVVDRPQGGTSLESGELELMVHRRLCFDDSKGVNEPLNETEFGKGLVVRGYHWLMFGERHFLMDQRAKFFAHIKHSPPWLFFCDAISVSFEQWTENYITEFSGLYAYVPRNIRILTLEPWREDTILLRLEHIFEKIPMKRLSNAPVIISLKDLFKNFEVLEVKETTLGANRWLSDTVRLKWKKSSVSLKEKKEREFLILQNMTISMKPQQIRTFILKIKAKNC